MPSDKLGVLEAEMSFQGCTNFAAALFANRMTSPYDSEGSNHAIMLPFGLLSTESEPQKVQLTFRRAYIRFAATPHGFPASFMYHSRLCTASNGLKTY